MSNSVRPHRWQPTRLPRPWDSPGKNAGVGCHFLLQCVKVKSESEETQVCPTPSDPMDCSLPGSFVHGIFQARVLEWGAIAFSKSNMRHTQKTNKQKQKHDPCTGWGRGGNQSIENYSWERPDIGLYIQSWYKYVQRAKRNHLCGFVGTMSHQVDINQDRNY